MATADLLDDIDVLRRSPLWEAIVAELRSKRGVHSRELMDSSATLDALRFAQGFVTGIDTALAVLDELHRQATRKPRPREE